MTKTNEIDISRLEPLLSDTIKSLYSHIKYEADSEICSKFIIKSTYISENKIYKYYTDSWVNNSSLEIYGQNKKLRKEFIRRLTNYKDPEGIDDRIFIYVYKMDKNSIEYISSYNENLIKRKVLKIKSIYGLFIILVLWILIAIVFKIQ
jgi:hypothetical protein